MWLAWAMGCGSGEPGEELIRLDGALIVAGEPLEGPFPDTAAWCARLQSQSQLASRCNVPLDGPGLYEGPETTSDPGSGWEEIRVLGVLSADGQDRPLDILFYHLGIRTRLGWFVLPYLTGLRNPGSGDTREDMTVERLQLEPLIEGGPPELVLRYTTRRTQPLTDGTTSYEKDTEGVFCGLSASGTPRCTRTLPLEGMAGFASQGREPFGVRVEPDRQARWKFDVEIVQGGRAMRIEGAVEGDRAHAPFDPTNLIGTHRLSLGD